MDAGRRTGSAQSRSPSAGISGRVSRTLYFLPFICSFIIFMWSPIIFICSGAI
jgi:hypothetical protein